MGGIPHYQIGILRQERKKHSPKCVLGVSRRRKDGVMTSSRTNLGCQGEKREPAGPKAEERRYRRKKKTVVGRRDAHFGKRGEESLRVVDGGKDGLSS